MKKKSFNKFPIILLIAAAICLAASTAGSAKATLTFISEHYSAHVEMFDIGVTLMENEEDVSWRDYTREDTWRQHTGVLLGKMLKKGEKLQVGKAYPEVLTVKNSGNIDTYVRVILTKSWRNPDGVKDPALSPAMIDLNLITGSNGWEIDNSATTPERTILYYKNILGKGEIAPAFSDTLTIDPAIASKVNEKVTFEDANDNGKYDVGEYRTITYTYEYDGYTFNIDAEVDSVQTHNAVDAIKSAWGVDVSVDSKGIISLK